MGRSNQRTLSLGPVLDRHLELTAEAMGWPVSQLVAHLCTVGLAGMGAPVVLEPPRNRPGTAPEPTAQTEPPGNLPGTAGPAAAPVETTEPPLNRPGTAPEPWAGVACVGDSPKLSLLGIDVSPPPPKPPPPRPRKVTEPLPALLPALGRHSGVVEMWGEWLQHRQQIGEPVTALAARRQMQLLDELGGKAQGVDSYEELICAFLRFAVSTGWQGLFPDRFLAERYRGGRAGRPGPQAAASSGHLADIDAAARRDS